MHIISAFEFELGKVTRPNIRERVIAQLHHMNKDLAHELKAKLGIEINNSADSIKIESFKKSSEKLSLIKNNFNHIKNRKAAILLAKGFDFGIYKK